MINVAGLFKYYRGVCALNGLTFDVTAGSIVGVAGANGAGKSTLFDILTTLDRDYVGDVLVGGMDTKREFREIRKVVGYVPGSFSLYPDLTVAENISFFAGMYGFDTSYLSNSSFWNSLKGFADRRACHLSGGMKQKLSIICAMVHSPKVLFLDEPTTGLDSGSRDAIWEELVQMKNNGMTIVASTHYYEEFGFMDKLLFFHQGNQLLYESLGDITGGVAMSNHFYDEYLSHVLEKYLKVQNGNR